MTTNELNQGISALKAGRKAEARSLLMQVVQQDERNEMAWLWLSGAVDTDKEQRICLENVLAINPSNGVAKRGLESLIAREGIRSLGKTPSTASTTQPNETPQTEPAQPPQEPMKSSTDQRKKPSKNRRLGLIVGLGVGALVLTFGALVVVWYVISNGMLLASEPPEPATASIAGTASIAIPTMTSVPVPTHIPTWTPIPTAMLIAGSPKDYLPSQSDMPAGYQLQPSASGPAADGAGYTQLYYNEDNYWSNSDQSFFVAFVATVHSTEDQAVQFYNDISSPTEIALWFGAESADLQAIDAQVSSVDESAAFAGSLTFEGTDTRATAHMSAIAIRRRNFAALVLTQSIADTPTGLQEALYYVSLVTEKLDKTYGAYESPIGAETPDTALQPTQASTLVPTPTLEETPVPIGHTAQAHDPNFPIDTAITVLEVRRGDKARSLFETWCLDGLHEQQEVIAVRLRIDYLSGPMGEMMQFNWLSFQTLYPDGSTAESFGLLCFENTNDKLDFEAYPPHSDEGWLAWTIRKGEAPPYLLYQYLIAGVFDYGQTLDPVVLSLE